MSCLFCKIIAGEVPGRFLYRDDTVAAIEDAIPQAPRHLLVLPIVHSSNLYEFTRAAGEEAIAKLFTVAAELGNEHGGFRVVVNNGEQAGQTVGHLHVHVLAGREMGWPPG